MNIINENEAQFLSSLQRGSRLIQRTLRDQDYRHGVFPGQDYKHGLFSGQLLFHRPHLCVCVCVSAAVAWSLHRDLGFPLDLVDLMLEERGFRVDHQELDTLISESKVCILWHPGASWEV